MKRREDWGPADEEAYLRQISGGILLAIIVLMLLINWVQGCL